MKILITGVGGSGKTTIIKELSKRGHTAIDLDDTDICFWLNKKTGEKSEYVEGTGPEWLDNNSWRLDVNNLKKLIEGFSPSENIFMGGKIAKSQLEEVSSLFDKIFLLNPSDSALAHRQSTREKENNFARSKEEQKHVAEKRKQFQDECIKNGAILIDGDKSVEEVLGKILP